MVMVNSAVGIGVAEDDPLWRHLIMAAPAERRQAYEYARLFDLRLASLVRNTTEPAIGQIRLVWWEEALTGDGSKGKGEPLVEAMWACWAPQDRAPITQMVDGWEALLLAETLNAEALYDYAVGRGALFALASGVDAPDWLKRAGEAWTLWDLSGHVGDPRVAALAIGMAKPLLEEVPRRGWPKELTPLRRLTGLVRADVKAGRAAPSNMTPRQYLRLLRLSLTG